MSRKMQVSIVDQTQMSSHIAIIQAARRLHMGRLCARADGHHIKGSMVVRDREVTYILSFGLRCPRAAERSLVQSGD